MDAENVKYLHEQFEFILDEVKKHGGWDQDSAGKLAMHLQSLIVKNRVADSLMSIDKTLMSISESLEDCSRHLLKANSVVRDGISGLVGILDRIRDAC